MLIVILCLVSMLVGWCLLFWDYADFTDMVGTALVLVGFIGIITSIIVIIISHIGTEVNIRSDKLEYDKIVAEVTVANSEYEDVSKTTVIEDVYNWNNKVITSKYWAHNIWTNWFWDAKRVNCRKTIDIEGVY